MAERNQVHRNIWIATCFEWVIWTILIALAVGGMPWPFPEQGRFVLEWLYQ